MENVEQPLASLEAITCFAEEALAEGTGCAVHADPDQTVALAAAAAKRALADGSSLLVAVPNEHARAALQRRLDDEGGIEKARAKGRATVLTAAELAARILAAHGERAGAPAPVLADSLQQQWLFEDLKVLGGKPKRLREMTKFLCRGMSELVFREEGWLISDEERSVLSALERSQRERGTLLPSFATAAAARALEDEELADALRFDVVVALGFSAFDRAGQKALERLGDTLIALGDTEDAGVPEIAYPFPAGLAAWGAASGGLARAAEAPRPTTPFLFDTAEQEREAVVRFACEQAAQGRSITVIAPTPRLARRCHRALCQAGASFSLLDKGPFAGLKLDSERDRAAVALYAALALLAEPRSPRGLRAWMGADAQLGGSDMWNAARTWAQHQDARLEDALASLPDHLESGRLANEDPLLVRAAERLEAARRLSERCAGLRGGALVQAIGEEGAIADADALAARAGVQPGDDAAALFARVRAAMGGTAVPAEARALVASVGDASYLIADGVMVVGAVDGLLSQATASDPSAPSDLRERARARDETRLRQCRRLARSFFVVTSFSSLDLQEASECGAAIERIFIDEGRYRARCHPTPLEEGWGR